MKNSEKIITKIDEQESFFEFSEGCSQDNFYHTPIVVNECDKPLDTELNLLIYPYSI